MLISKFITEYGQLNCATTEYWQVNGATADYCQLVRIDNNLRCDQPIRKDNKLRHDQRCYMREGETCDISTVLREARPAGRKTAPFCPPHNKSEFNRPASRINVPSLEVGISLCN